MIAGMRGLPTETTLTRPARLNELRNVKFTLLYLDFSVSLQLKVSFWKSPPSPKEKSKRAKRGRNPAFARWGVGSRRSGSGTLGGVEYFQEGTVVARERDVCEPFVWESSPPPPQIAC